MNAAQSLFGISQLEAAKKVTQKNIGLIDYGYIIEQENGDLPTLKELCDFWVEGHKKIDNAKEIIRDIERITKEEKKLPTEQKMEGFQTQEECSAERIGPDNSKEIVQGSKSSSQKSKRGRVRKSNK